MKKFLGCESSKSEENLLNFGDITECRYESGQIEDRYLNFCSDAEKTITTSSNKHSQADRFNAPSTMRSSLQGVRIPEITELRDEGWEDYQEDLVNKIISGALDPEYALFLKINYSNELWEDF